MDGLSRWPARSRARSRPDFTLPGTGGRSYSLSEYRGQPVVLVFYPGDNTPVCTKQLNAYTDDIGQFADVGAQVLAISPQSVESHEGFAAKHGFAFPLLADADKKVGRAATAPSARSASRGAACSWSTATASSATPTAPSPA